MMVLSKLTHFFKKHCWINVESNSNTVKEINGRLTVLENHVKEKQALLNGENEWFLTMNMKSNGNNHL